MTRHLLLPLQGATETECGACRHFKSESYPTCGLFKQELGGYWSTKRLPECLAAERAAHDAGILSHEATAKLAEILENPPEPPEALKRLSRELPAYCPACAVPSLAGHRVGCPALRETAERAARSADVVARLRERATAEWAKASKRSDVPDFESAIASAFDDLADELERERGKGGG